MVADTIIVIMLCIMPSQKPKEISQNRFTKVFEQADKDFCEKHKLDIEKLKKASEEAAREAYEKTKCELEKIVKPKF